MLIGFTGSQHGMTDWQRERLKEALARYRFIAEFHHGDCVGADDEADDVARELRIPFIVVHPPVDTRRQAFTFKKPPTKGVSIEVRTPKPFLLRNRDIIHDSDELLATPRERTERLRSGTWSTIRFARRLHRPIHIIYPHEDK